MSEEKKTRKRRSRKPIIEQAEQNIQASEQVADAVEETPIIEVAAPVEAEATIDNHITDAEDISVAYVEPTPIVEVTDNEPKKKTKKSSCVKFDNPVWLYPSSVSTKYLRAIAGTFYKWSDEVVTGRIAITDSHSGCGVDCRVLGWVDIADIK